MIKTADVADHNSGDERNVKECFPMFYRKNKKRVDTGKIKWFYDGFATNVGCLIDIETLENYIIDTRA